MARETQVNFADIDSRARLEFEVSQYADGTLSPDRVEAVRHAVATDPSLATLLDDFRSVDSLLTRQPDFSAIPLGEISGNVMHIVRMELEPFGVPIALGHGAQAAAQASATAWWATPWVGGLAAALLAVGLTVGVVVMQGDGPSTMDIVGPVGNARPMAASEINIEGPAAGSQLMMADGTDSGTMRGTGGEVLSVRGPDIGAARDPQVTGFLPDYAAIYAGSSSVLDAPSRVVVASTDPSLTEGGE